VSSRVHQHTISCIHIGSADFYAIDSYRSSWVVAPDDGIAACVKNTLHPLWPECHDVRLFDSNAGWAGGPNPDPAAESWLLATPQVLRPYLKELQTRWPTNKMVLDFELSFPIFFELTYSDQYISEFGFVEPFEELRSPLFRITEDVDRTSKFRHFSIVLCSLVLSW
jgi:beta-glucosidase